MLIHKRRRHAWACPKHLGWECRGNSSLFPALRQPGFPGCALRAYPRMTVGRCLFPDEGRSSLGAGLRAQLVCGIHVCGGRRPSGGLRRRGTQARRTASAPHLSNDREAAGLPVRMMRVVRVSCGRRYSRRDGGRTASYRFLFLQFSRPTVFCAKRLKLLAKISGFPPNLHTRPSNKMWCNFWFALRAKSGSRPSPGTRVCGRPFHRGLAEQRKRPRLWAGGACWFEA